MSQTTIASATPIEMDKAASRYYRPELDVLRFFAFFCVFVAHGPDWNLGSPATWERHALVIFYIVKQMGAFGLSIFFMLSSYLITELLVREVGLTGSIHLKAFYVRRILRIWPLYYLGVCIGIVGGLLSGHQLTSAQIGYLVFFVGWLGRGSYHNGMGILWSISVEELFYLIWPSVARFGGLRSLFWLSLAIIPTSIAVSIHSTDWYNPLIQFLFFALGALLSISLPQQTFKPRIWARAAMIVSAIPAWWIAAKEIGGFEAKLAGSRAAEAFALIAIGCVLVFLASYNLPARFTPRPLLYLGKISYGLYVFHHICLILSGRLLSRLLGLHTELLRIPLVYMLAFAITVALASLSYHYFEKPFLRLKERFTFVPSRA